MGKSPNLRTTSLNSERISYNCPLKWVLLMSFEHCLIIFRMDWSLSFLKFSNFHYSRKIIWFFVPNLGNYYLLLKWQEIPLLLKSFAKPCYLLRNSRKERNNKRILKFKSAKFVGILELSWPRVLTLTFMTRSNESRTRWPCAHELVRGRPMYLWILFPILGSTLLHVDMVKYCKDSCNTPNCINGYKQPFPNIVLDRLYTI